MAPRWPCPEAHLAWHVAEVSRLRGLLHQLQRGGWVTGARVEFGASTMCVTATREADEHAILDAVKAWCASRGFEHPGVAAKLRELAERAELAEAFAGLLAAALTLPDQGERLGPGPCEVLKKLGEDAALLERCSTSMRSLLDANRAAVASRTFAVDAAEWGRAEPAAQDNATQPEGTP